MAPITNEDQNIQKEASTSSGTVDKNDELVIDIRKILKLPDNESSTRCYIHKVPRHLRKWNEEAYTPQVVSIGPFHHNDKRLKAMEEHKERYFRSFMKRSEIKFEYLVDRIRKMEERIRGCYEETTDLTNGEFVKMILVDASFILELFIRKKQGSKTRNDLMFVIPRSKAMRFDLSLLENQLPFFVIKDLHQLTFRSMYELDPNLFNCGDLVQLSLEYFEDPCFEFRDNVRSNVKIEHFTDLLRTFQLPPRKKRPKRVHTDTEYTDLLYTATQLHEAGVKFEVDEESECRFDLKFEKGVLKIPKFELNDWTEVAIRNIMALEQTRYIEDTYFTDHLFLMDSLINTKEDVDLLCENKILVNYLGDNNAAKSMINDLNKGIIWTTNRDDYIDLYEKLNRFCEYRWHRWKATLKREYCSTPWRIASTVAAIILLVLTFIQTVCSVGK